MSFDNTHHLYLVDGSGFIFRAFYGLPALTRKSDGMPVGAVSGFCNMIYRMQENLSGDAQPSHFAVVFDAARQTFRNEIYADYKAHRPPAPNDLQSQLPLIREAARAFGLPCVEALGYEADDVIATYARQAAGQGAKVTVVSSDKDLMQLVTDRIGMLDPISGQSIGRAQVVEKFGVGPAQVVDVQALAGDSADNVPGAPGIGLKIAAQLINEYGDLETLLARAGEIKQPKRRQSLQGSQDLIRVSQRLVQLDDSVPDLPDCDSLTLAGPVGDTLVAFLREMEFATLTRRVEENMGIEGPAPVLPPVANRPRPASQLLEWHKAAIAGKAPPIHDGDPQIGWFKTRMVKDGPFVPARIWIDREICPRTGELIGAERFTCTIDGERRDPFSQWVWLAKNPITKAAYDALSARRTSMEAMAATHIPFDLTENIIRP